MKVVSFAEVYNYSYTCTYNIWAPPAVGQFILAVQYVGLPNPLKALGEAVDIRPNGTLHGTLSFLYVSAVSKIWISVEVSK